MDFADYLVTRRLELGLSADDLAERAGLRRLTIENLEGGDGWPMPGSISGLADALDVDESELVQLVESEQWGGRAPEFRLYDPEFAEGLGLDDGAPEWIGRPQFRELLRLHRQQVAQVGQRRGQGVTSRGPSMPGKLLPPRGRAPMPGRPASGSTRRGRR